MEKKYLNLRGISEILSEKELRNVVGACGGTGSGVSLVYCSRTCKNGTTYTISCYGTCEERDDEYKTVCVPNGGPGDGGGFILCEKA